MAPVRVAWWIRTDLRLHDNVALAAALELKPDNIWPIWTWDPHYVYHARVSPNRWRFLLDCQRDLSDSILQKTGNKNGLLVLRGNPEACLAQALKAWKITHLVFEKDTDTYARQRDRKITDMAERMGIKVIIKLGRTLYDPDEMTKNNSGKAIYNIATIQKIGPTTGKIARPLEAPDHIPPAGDTTLDVGKDDSIEVSPDLNESQRIDGTQAVTCYERMQGPDGKFAVPTMEELNMKEAPGPHRGGETEALRSLESYISDKKKTATFEKPKTNPGVFLPPETTLLSPHLHFGSLSIRKFYWSVMDTVKAYGPASSSPPVSLEGQLLFRDMYFAAQAATENYEQTRGNPHCRFIPWRLANTYDSEGNVTGYDKESDPEAEIWFQRWRTGMTGFPWIDAIMRQLNRDGWIHHLARHSVACFLTRGHCYISWERGADGTFRSPPFLSRTTNTTVFEELLIDHETACNVGNWQWLSCTAFFSQLYRVYSPVAFGKKWDKSGALIREYVPELRDVPDRYIYEPWLLSRPDQKAAKVRLVDYSPMMAGQTYPRPMLDVKEQARICLDGMKASYEAKIYGDDARVVSGAAEKIIQSHGTIAQAKGEGTPTKTKRGLERGQASLDGAFTPTKKKKQQRRQHGGEATDDLLEAPKQEEAENEQNNV